MNCYELPSVKSCGSESSKKRSVKSNDVPQKYEVERILQKKGKGKRMKYLLKWKGYSDEHNSWVLKEKMDCPDLLAQFEAVRNRRKNRRSRVIIIDRCLNDLATCEDLLRRESEEVVHIESTTPLMIWVRNKASGTARLLPGNEVHSICPQSLIRFYEERVKLVWH